MRMWMVEPELMCDKHLLGEHVEIHMMIGSWNRGISFEGFYKNNLCEPTSFHTRHEALVADMARRGMNHRSPLPSLDQERPIPLASVDINSSFLDLIGRCQRCNAIYRTFLESNQ